MKSIIKLISFITVLAYGPITHATQLYDYAYTFADGHTVSGSFNGVANGDLISDLTNITAALDNESFPASFGEHWTDNAQVGGAIVSFSGLNNNFFFVDQEYAVTGAYVQYFRSLSGSVTDSYNIASGVDHVDWDFEPTRWSVVTTAQQVPEPGTYTMLLTGLGLMGFMLRRKT